MNNVNMSSFTYILMISDLYQILYITLIIMLVMGISQKKGIFIWHF